MSNRFENADLPYFSAIMATMFGSDEQVSEAKEFLGLEE